MVGGNSQSDLLFGDSYLCTSSSVVQKWFLLSSTFHRSYAVASCLCLELQPSQPLFAVNSSSQTEASASWLAESAVSFYASPSQNSDTYAARCGNTFDTFCQCLFPRS